jgi:membrane peptidoglycan carboxypeptidase
VRKKKKAAKAKPPAAGAKRKAQAPGRKAQGRKAPEKPQQARLVETPDEHGASRAARWSRRAAIVVVAGLAVALVPAMREAAAAATSRAILVLASPLTPGVPDLSKLPEPSKVLASDGSVLATLSDEARAIVPLAQIPVHVRRAVLAAEDQNFYRHSGVDPSAVLRALVSTVRGHLQGGSTITQQLAKINYTARERSILRKLREVLYASSLERHYTKDQLLERYLNQVYFGDGAYGIDAAAEAFFGVHAAQLTPAQAATLAGKIRAPEGLDPRRDPEAVIARRNRVIDSMAARGWLPAGEAAAARVEPMKVVPPQPPGVVKAPHFVEFVKREARNLEELGSDDRTRLNRLYTGGYTITTTLDPKVFDATQTAVKTRLGDPGDPLTAVASVVPGDGAVRSLFGGLDFATMQFDISSQGARQPGSAFKPFVYLAALRDHIDPRSTFDGTSGRRIPCYGDRIVNNYAGEDAGGRIDLDTAMAHSVNVVFVELGCQVGVHNVVNAATDDGIPKNATDAQGAVFLGGLDRGVNPLQMAAAYATFTAGGVYAEPYSVASVRSGGGEVVYQHEAKTKQVFKAEEVGVLNRSLQRVVTEGTGTGAGIGRPVAGKTGTTQGNDDAWFVGYVPQLATAVWTGYEPHQPMSHVHGRAVTGGSFPAAIFGDLMRQSLAGVKVKDIPTATPDKLGLSLVGPDATSTTTSSSSSTTTTAPPSSTTASTEPESTSTTSTTTGRAALPPSTTSSTTATTVPRKSTTTSPQSSSTTTMTR